MIPLLCQSVVTRQRQQLALRGLRVPIRNASGFRRCKTNDQSIRSLPIRPFAAGAHECQIVPHGGRASSSRCLVILCSSLSSVLLASGNKKARYRFGMPGFRCAEVDALRIVSRRESPARLSRAANAGHAVRERHGAHAFTRKHKDRVRRLDVARAHRRGSTPARPTSQAVGHRAHGARSPFVMPSAWGAQGEQALDAGATSEGTAGEDVSTFRQSRQFIRRNVFRSDEATSLQSRWDSPAPSRGNPASSRAQTTRQRPGQSVPGLVGHGCASRSA